LSLPHLHNDGNYLMLDVPTFAWIVVKRNPSGGISVSTIEFDEET
jgi:hypothetical protein